MLTDGSVCVFGGPTELALDCVFDAVLVELLVGREDLIQLVEATSAEDLVELHFVRALLSLALLVQQLKTLGRMTSLFTKLTNVLFLNGHSYCTQRIYKMQLENVGNSDKNLLFPGRFWKR